MKQKIYILGLGVLILLFSAVTFKLNHFPGAGVLLAAGIITLVLVFLPLALRSSFRSEGGNRNLLLYVVTWVTALVVFGSMLFKLMHWPGAGKLIIVALPFPFVVFLPVYLYRTSKIENYSIYNTVFIMLLLTVVSVLNALLSLNVSRNTITESLNLSVPYNLTATALKSVDFSDSGRESVYPLQLGNADEVLKLIAGSRELILREAGSTPEEWHRAPAELRFPDSRKIAQMVMLEGGINSQAAKLESAISELIASLEEEPALQEAGALIRELSWQGSGNDTGSSWANTVFGDMWLSWALVWLDEMEMNIAIIRTLIDSYTVDSPG